MTGLLSIKGLYTFEDLKNLSSKQIRTLFGGKAAGLYEAVKLGIKVPTTWLFSIEHYEFFFSHFAKKSGVHFKKEASEWILENSEKDLKLLPEAYYAVRSSSQYEDAHEHSFAGIFESKLGCRKDDIPFAIAEVWDSCFSLRVKSYSKEKGDLRMGVVIQPMVEPKYSGVAFSKHPSPSHVYENQNIVIEFAPQSGEKIVQGEITPFRLSGTFDSLIAASDSPWIVQLLQVMLELKKIYRHEIDIEFVVDKSEDFWLLQQRPISVIHSSHVLDLSFYQRKYKRALFTLDVELLIEGCSLFLSSYLEIPYQLEKWMVMTTVEDKVQELWVHSLLDQAITNKMSQKIGEDFQYLLRIEERYKHHNAAIFKNDYTIFFQSSLPLKQRFFAFCEFILPLEAHYYVPMFMIDALHSLIQEEFKKIDPDNAESDLFYLGTWNIASLMEIFYDELRSIRKNKTVEYAKTFEELEAEDQAHLKKITEHYGFLKCRSIEETGYTMEEIFVLLKTIPDKKNKDSLTFETLSKKYLKNEKISLLFMKFREWMRIRNQEMEFLMYALLKSRPLFEEICKKCGCSIRSLWNTSRESILSALNQHKSSFIEEFSTQNLVIFRSYGKTRCLNKIHIVKSYGTTQGNLRGKTVYGSGKLVAKVKLAFSIKELEAFSSDECTVLVTGMTTPDFIPHIKKHFAALITDEGGILCHAAIVAREIPIPCIVGTALATETLKEGSLVSINFDLGEIHSFET